MLCAGGWLSNSDYRNEQIAKTPRGRYSAGMNTWLFRPFDLIGGRLALALGAVALIATALLASATGLVTDGVLDLHLWPASLGPTTLLLMGLINWLSLSLALLAVGHWLSPSKYQLLDLFAMQAMARWPMFLAVAYLSVPFVRRETERLTEAMLAAMPEQSHEVIAAPAYLLDAMWLFALSIPILLAIVWMVWLMYHGYARVFKVNGWQAVLGFVAALIVAEFGSKALILMVLL